MKRPIFAKTRSMIRHSPGQVVTRLAKTGRRSLDGISESIQKNEYPVFIEPVERRIPDSLKGGLRHVFRMNTNAVADVETSQEAPNGPLEVNENPTASGLVDEIFTQPTIPFEKPDEDIETEEPEEITLSADHDDVADEEVAKTPLGTAGPSAPSRMRPENAPLVRTMVEALPDSQFGEGNLGDFLAEDLQDLFSVHDYTNPRTKALLKSREHIDVHELAEELAGYSREIGAST